MLQLLLMLSVSLVCQAAAPPSVPGYKHYLGFCVVFKNEARYLREWIEFHKLQGAAKFYLYSNNSTDSSKKVVQPYLDKGLAKWFDWPDVRNKGGGLDTQCAAYRHCLSHFATTRWLAFIDVDEFMFPGNTSVNSLLEVLPQYEAYGGLVVRNVLYGSSGHLQRPRGPVIENYLWRAPITDPTYADDEDDVLFHVKSVVDGARGLGCGKFGAHIIFLNQTGLEAGAPKGVLVNEAFEVHDKVGKNAPKGQGLVAQIRTNHYKAKSREDWSEKKRKGVSQGAGAAKKFAKPGNQWEAVDRNDEYDDAILRFMPKLRRALNLGKPWQYIVG